MLTVQHYLEIRTAHARGESVRSIARRLKRSQRTIRKAIASDSGAPAPYVRIKPADCPKLGKFLPIIDQILKDDESAPPKQRHTAMQIYRRLMKEHDYSGKYDQVRRYVKKRRRQERETFIPLAQDAGSRVECDFGEVWVDFPETQGDQGDQGDQGGRRLVSVLIVTWSFSHLPFMVALPTQRTEAILQGMVLAFEFFGCVPVEVWWDNPTTVATEILTGRDRTLNRNYAALASHYRFTPLFCMPAKGQEKSDVESAVRGLHKRFCTPVPQMADMAEFNRFLLGQCLAERARTVSGQTLNIGQNFELDKSRALPLPDHRFDPCVSRAGVVDKYQLVALDTNHYSVPRGAAFCPVTIKAYADQVQVVQDGQVIATHVRSYGRHESILDPLHYLAALGRKPGCLDHGGVFRGWKLPAVFAELRVTLERRHGVRGGLRHYIRVLQLLTTHPAERVARAIAKCHRFPGGRTLTAELIAEQASALAAAAGNAGVAATTEAIDPEIVRRVQVPLPDLRQFDQLFNNPQSTPGFPGAARGPAEGKTFPERDVSHVRIPPFPPTRDDVIEEQPQDVATTDHAGGV
jgi:transposase